MARPKPLRFKDVAQAARRLRRACDALKSANSKTRVEVGYWDARALLEYFYDTRDAASRVARARDELHNVFFKESPP